MSTMGVTDVLTKFGETEKIDSSSVSPVFDFSGGLLITDCLLQLRKVADGCWKYWDVLFRVLFCCAI